MGSDQRNFVLITGCSSGGKSTLLDALAHRGYPVIPEAGRRIVLEERSNAGDALPWVNLEKFAQRALEVSLADLSHVDASQDLVFFDRGVVDAAIALQSSGGQNYRLTLGETRHYAKTVFLAPPWKAIYETDTERKHGFEDAKDEYVRLKHAVNDLGYVAYELPKAAVQDRVMFVLQTLDVV